MNGLEESDKTHQQNKISHNHSHVNHKHPRFLFLINATMNVPKTQESI
jgi:hypothetical protein